MNPNRLLPTLPVLLAAAVLAFGAFGAFALPARAEVASVEDALKEISYGKADAPVVIYGFESLSCPHCRDFHVGAWPKIKKTYVDTGKVRFVLRDFPHNAQGFLGILTARCLGPARAKGMVEILFANQAQWAFLGRDKFYKALGRYARLGGMSEADFKACLDSKDIVKGISNSVNEATAKYEVKSVPSFLIGTKQQIDSGAAKRIDGAQPFETFDRIVKEVLAAAGRK